MEKIFVLGLVSVTLIQLLLSMLRSLLFASARRRPSRRSPLFVSAAAAVAGAMLWFAVPLVAQDPVVPTPAEAALSLDVGGLEASLAAIEADAGIEDAVKASLRPKYKEAIASLNDAAGNGAKAASYRDALKTAPGQTADFQAKLKALPSAESAARVIAGGSTEDLQKEADARRVALAELKSDLEKATSDLIGVKGRPVEIGERLPQARSELAKMKEQLASPDFAASATSPRQVADRLVLEAAQSKLTSELEMLEQEQLSQSLREGLLQAQCDLLNRQVENAGASVDSLTALVNQRLTSEAREVASQAGATSPGVAGADKQTQALTASVQELAKEFEDVVGRLKEVSAEQDDIAAQQSLLNREYGIIQEQLKLGGVGGSLVRTLFTLRQRLSSSRALALQTKELRVNLGETRLAALQIEEKLRNQAAVEKEFADRSSDAVARLLATRREVLTKLQTQYANLVRAMAALEGDQVKYADNAREVGADVLEQLFWVRSSPPVSASTLIDLPAGLRWFFSARHWREFGNSLSDVIVREPILSGTIAILLGLLLLMGRRLRAALRQCGVKVRSISTDRYAFTGRALFYTVLLALPIPILMLSAAWALGQDPDPSAWLEEMTRGLLLSGVIISALLFLAAVCCPGGLGTAHFGWSEEASLRLRRAAFWFGIVYIPALLVTASSIVGDSNLLGKTAQYFHSVGRISFILAQTWTAILLWKLLQPRDGILSAFVHDHPTRLIAQWRYLWFPLVIACPVALVGLALLGYLFSAIALSIELCVTMALVAGGVILYSLALRWFTIPERKLALDEAVEERRARREASATTREQEEESGEVVSVELEEEKLDLTAIGQQTRQFLRFLFTLGVLVAVVLLWTETVLPVMNKIRPVGGLSLLSLGQAVLIVVVALMATHNLPGLLELALLRATKIEAGTRTAIITLCQYAVIALGLALLFNVLNVDWARFGWIAAALSVGLGFGLQEVVANFVCGIILLFERPIRVGDVVTVEGTTGTVTKIQMRATTIMNWDRQELVVPNKNLITGTLLNWTLSTALSRVLITVGVAYGSDTEKARQILLAVATDNPRVLDEPAPMASFEEFADSSLTLRLRAYLPGIDDRIKTITELHAEIDRRFAEAGIEIAFPQRDLHLRSGWEGAGRAGFKGGAGEKTEGA